MAQFDEYCKVFAEKIQDFEEKCGSITNFAAKETSSLKKHKLTVKEADFRLPEEVLKELQELERADLTDFEELWKS